MRSPSPSSADRLSRADRRTGLPAIAHAQDAPALRAHRFTVGAGMVWSGGYDIGDATAQLARQRPRRDTAADSRCSRRIRASRGDRAGIAGRLCRRRRGWRSKSALALTRPHIGVAIAGDAEAPSQELPGEELQQYVFDGGVTWQLPIRMGARAGAVRVGRRRLSCASCTKIARWPRPGRSTMPVAARATGCAAGTARGRAFGLRGDARVNFRRNGIDFEDKMRTYPTFSSLFVGFDVGLLTSPSSSPACRPAAAAAACCEDVSIAIGAGEIVALVGRSGSGKTTLLRLVNRLIEPDAGSVIVDGRPTQRVGSDRAAPPDRLRDPGRRAVSRT